MLDVEPRQKYLKRELKRTTGFRPEVESMSKGEVSQALVPGEMGIIQGNLGALPVVKLHRNSAAL